MLTVDKTNGEKLLEAIVMKESILRLGNKTKLKMKKGRNNNQSFHL